MPTQQPEQEPSRIPDVESLTQTEAQELAQKLTARHGHAIFISHRAQDTEEVALSAIREALNISEVPEAHERTIFAKRDPSFVVPSWLRERLHAGTVSEEPTADEVLKIKDLVLQTINSRLGSPDDHLAYIRNELRSVVTNVGS